MCRIGAIPGREAVVRMSRHTGLGPERMGSVTMRRLNRTIWMGMALTLARGAMADGPTLRKDDVVPVVMMQDLKLSQVQVGDSFSAKVADSSYLPDGTILDGRITKVVPNQGNKAGYFDLAFTDVQVPGEGPSPLDATPIPLNSKDVKRGPDGRFVAPHGITKEQAVAGGAIGGLLIGSLMKKPFEGAFVGTLLGIVVGESNQGANDMVLAKGTKLGALVNGDVTLDLSTAANANDQTPLLDRGAASDQNRAYDVKYKDQQLNFPKDQQPYWAGDVLMVPLDWTAQQMNLQVERASDGPGIFVEDGDSVARIEMDSRDLTMDGHRQELPRGVVKKGDHTYAPIDLFGVLKNGQITVNGTKLVRPA